MKDVALTRATAGLRYSMCGDSLSMPVHWFYSPNDIKRAFPPSGITKLEPPPPKHPSSIMNLHSTRQGGRAGASSWFGGKSSSAPKEIVGQVILKGQRQYWNKPNEHYHRNLRRGENTLNLQCSRVLIRNLIANAGEYDPSSFVDSYVAFMCADPPLHNDTYAESYHRGFFANLVNESKDKLSCGAVTHDTPSIGGLTTVGPLAIHLLLRNSYSLEQVQAMVRAHLFLTHPDESLAKVCDLYVELISKLLFRDSNENVEEILLHTATTSSKLFRGQNLQRVLQLSDTDVIGGMLSPACYISGSWPGVLYLAIKYISDPMKGLLANANVGGDNCHRGAVLGLLFGLMDDLHNNKELPKLYEELLARDEYEEEVRQLVQLAKL